MAQETGLQEQPIETLSGKQFRSVGVRLKRATRRTALDLLLLGNNSAFNMGQNRGHGLPLEIGMQ